MIVSLNDFGLRVADHVTAMLAYWDKDLLCRFANVAYLEWFGKSRDEMINKITLPELLGPSLYEKNQQFIRAALQGRKQIFERDISTPSGDVRHSLATYIPDILSDGRVNGFFVHVADITSVKNMEIELLKKSNIINDQNKRLLNFANIVSHNLSSYSGNLYMLLKLYKESDVPAEKDTLFSHLESISSSFIATVKNLKEIVQMQNLLALRSEEINLFQFVDRVKEILREEISASKAEVQNLIYRDQIIIANPAYIESILLNLISNAIRYRHPDRTPEIRVSAAATESQVTISVSDNGLGIDTKTYGDDLFRLYKTFHSHPDSKGIGLFITKFQVESMGGHIEIESSVGVGSTFRVFLPKDAAYINTSDAS